MNAALHFAPFLVFEGLDGSGKTTIIELLVAELEARKQRTVLTREPGGTPLAEEIRSLLLRTDSETPVAATEVLLYSASRAQHVARVIRPAISRGEWVLCDRFSSSSISFQCFARGLSRNDIEWLNAFAQQGLNPDLTILLDLTVEESQRRQSRRNQTSGSQRDRMELEAQDFHEAVRRGYLTQAEEKPNEWLVIDATQTPTEICKQVLSELQRRKWLDS